MAELIQVQPETDFRKAVTLEIALALRTILTNEYEGVSVTMSRTSDKTVSLTERTDAANSWGADYFLSIHINSGGGTGFESYIYPGVGAPTSTYQSAVHTQVIQASGFNDRGKKQPTSMCCGRQVCRRF